MFNVPEPGMTTTFSFDSATKVPTVSVTSSRPLPDLTVADAIWLDDRTVAYPVDRLPAGVDPAWSRFRLHWGDLAVDATSLGGLSAPLTIVEGAPEGYVALALDRQIDRRELQEIHRPARRRRRLRRRQPPARRHSRRPLTIARQHGSTRPSSRPTRPLPTRGVPAQQRPRVVGFARWLRRPVRRS